MPDTWETRINGVARIRTIQHPKVIELNPNRRFESYVLNGRGSGESLYAPTEDRARINHSILVKANLP